MWLRFFSDVSLKYFHSSENHITSNTSRNKCAFLLTDWQILIETIASAVVCTMYLLHTNDHWILCSMKKCNSFSFTCGTTQYKTKNDKIKALNGWIDKLFMFMMCNKKSTCLCTNNTHTHLEVKQITHAYASINRWNPVLNAHRSMHLIYT